MQPAGFTDRWRTVPLWTLFRRVARRGRETEDLLSVYRDHGVVPRGFTDDNWNRIPDDLSNYLLVEPGDLVLNKMKAWQGSLGVSRLRGIVSPAYFVFAPVRRGYDERFLHHLLRSRPFVESYGRMSGGIRVDQWDLDPWAFSRLVVPVPQISEQRAIADFVDRETAKIDALIVKQNELIALLRVRRRHTIELAVNPLTVPDWERQPLKRALARIDQGISPDTSSATEDAVFWVLKTGASNHGIFDEQESKPVPDSVTVPRHIEVMTGDLVVSRASGSPDLVGSVAIAGTLTRRLILSDKNFRLIPASTVDARFLYWALNSPNYRSQVRLAISGADGLANNLPLSSLRRIRLWLPQLPEQRQIAQRLDHETTKIDALIAKAEEHIALAQERRAALITAAVTGQIDITGKVA